MVKIKEKLYNEIFKRKSVRKYKPESLDEKTLIDISNFINNEAKALYRNINIESKIVSKSEIKSLLPINAPHYILLFSETKEGYLNNAGFILQQLDLYFSANRLGSCWFGLSKPAREVREKSNLNYVITLAFGKTDKKLHRQNLAEFKRKDITDIRDKKGKDKLLEAARLAPSATNGQPWFFKVFEDKIDVYRQQPNFIKAIFYDKMNKIDMGIAICHIWLAANHFNKTIEFDLSEENVESLKEYIYVLSLRFPKSS